MNKLFLTRVVEKVKEKDTGCTKCGKKAEFEIVKNVILIKNCCCKEHFKYISMMIEKEREVQLYKI